MRITKKGFSDFSEIDKWIKKNSRYEKLIINIQYFPLSDTYIVFYWR